MSIIGLSQRMIHLVGDARLPKCVDDGGLVRAWAFGPTKRTMPHYSIMANPFANGELYQWQSLGGLLLAVHRFLKRPLRVVFMRFAASNNMKFFGYGRQANLTPGYVLPN